MLVNVDLRYLLLPLVNLYLIHFHPFQSDNNPYYHVILVAGAFFAPVFLIVSANVRLDTTIAATSGPIYFRAGDFSVFVTGLLLCSPFMSVSRFLIFYAIVTPIFIVTSTYRIPLLISPIKRTFFWCSAVYDSWASCRQEGEVLEDDHEVELMDIEAQLQLLEQPYSDSDQEG